MHTSLSILLHHGYLVVFLWVLAGQAGLPSRPFPSCWQPEAWPTLAN